MNLLGLMDQIKKWLFKQPYDFADVPGQGVTGESDGFHRCILRKMSMVGSGALKTQCRPARNTALKSIIFY